MKRLIVVAVVTSLTGCGWLWRKTPEPVIPPLVPIQKEVNIDPALLEECPPLVKLEGSKDVQILEANKKWFDAYQECQNKKSKLNILVKQAFNLKK